MRMEQFTLDKYEFKFQPLTAIQYWNITNLLEGVAIKDYNVLRQALCDKNISVLKAGGTPQLLTQALLDEIAGDPEIPHNFFTKLYNKFVDYINLCDDELTSLKKK